MGEILSATRWVSLIYWKIYSSWERGTSRLSSLPSLATVTGENPVGTAEVIEKGTEVGWTVEMHVVTA